MYPLVPPPLNDTGAQSWPRQLQRWLDVNPISKLTRTQGYFVMPTFSVNVTWLGYSDIVAAFNYEGPSNFSLNGIGTLIPLNPNYLCCISWRDNNGHIYRYALWQNVGEVFFFDVPLYTGQVIMANFRLEIWSVANQAVASQSSSLTLYTSVLGKQDYRWATDFVLVNPDTISTNFSVGLISTQGLSPQLAPAGVTFGGWLRADINVAGSLWTEKAGGSTFFTANLAAGSNIITTTDSTIKNNTEITGPLPIVGPVQSSFNPADIWIMLKYNGDGKILVLQGTSTLSITAGILYSDGSSLGNTPLTIGAWYVIEWWNFSGYVQANIWEVNGLMTNKAYSSNVTGVSRTGSTNLWVGYAAGSASINVTDILVYSQILQAADQQTNLNYFMDRYLAQFALPFVWPVGSYSQPNSPSFIPLNNNNIPISGNQPIESIYISSGGGVLGAG
jgi:hypothetical protein